MHTNTKPFRISSRKVFLTHSQVDPCMQCEHLLQILQAKSCLGSFYYLVAKKPHSDQGAHLHALFLKHGNHKLNARQSNLLNIEYNNVKYHGHSKPVKPLSQAVSYACKRNQYITNIPNLQGGGLVHLKEMLFQQVKQKGISQALLDYTHEDLPRPLSSTPVSGLKRQFDDIKQMQDSLQDEPEQIPVNLTNFKLEGRLKEWVDSPHMQPNKTLILVGNSGVGKTLFAKAFAKEKHLKTLVVSHKEDFCKLDPSFEALIVADADPSQFTNTQLLALFDNTVDKALRALYRTVKKRKNLVQIVIINLRGFKLLYLTFVRNAIARGVLMHQPKEPFMINVNLNLTNNWCVQTHQHNPRPDTCQRSLPRPQSAQPTRKGVDSAQHTGLPTPFTRK